MMDVDVIILGLNLTGLGVLQGLGERGVKLLGIDNNRAEIGFYSRFGKKVAVDFCCTIEWLVNYGQRMGRKGLLLPTSDDYLLLLVENEQELKKYFHLPFQNADLVSTLLNKYKFYKLVSQYTNDLPECRLIGKDNLIDWYKWPAIVKPVYIHEFRKLFPNRKAFIVNDGKELQDIITLLSKVGIEAILQEIVTGPDNDQYAVCAYISRDKSDAEVMVSHKVRQNPPGFGVGTYVEIVEDTQLTENALTLLGKIGYTGIAEVEYRRDRNDGQFKLIEINPRVWTQNKLASYSGHDIIGAIVRDYLQLPMTPLPANARKWFFLPRDLLTCFLYLRQGDTSLATIWQSYFPASIRVGAIWNRKDLRVAIAQPLYLFTKLHNIMKKHS